MFPFRQAIWTRKEGLACAFLPTAAETRVVNSIPWRRCATAASWAMKTFIPVPPVRYGDLMLGDLLRRSATGRHPFGLLHPGKQAAQYSN
jgi:hypothetical protein